MLPGVEIEAVEGADGSEEQSGGCERQAEVRGSRDGGDEDGGGEEEADGEFFG